jgi:hypothetical protein
MKRGYPLNNHSTKGVTVHHDELYVQAESGLCFGG